MSFQRNARTKPAAMRDGGGMGTVRFLVRCSEALERAGKDDAAFYFEQLVDHLRSGGAMNENENVSRVLGL